MKSIFYICLIFTIISCSYSYKKNCDSVRNGHFIFNSSSTKKSYLIDRNDSVQYETRKENGRRWRFKITWIGECKYNLNYLDQDKGDTDEVFFKELDFKILKVSKRYYVFSMSVPNIKKELVDTIWKLN